MKNLSAKLYAPILSALLYLYFLLFYDASLFYHYHQPMFLFSGAFLKDFLLYPGGVLDWINFFIFQFFIWNWAGAMILTLITLSVFIVIYRILKRAGINQSAFLVSMIPIAFLLLLLNQYHAPLVISLRFLMAILLFTLYSRASKIKPVFILMSWPIYLLLGGWTFLFYCILVMLHELMRSDNKMRFVYAGMHIVAGGFFPLIAAKFLFLITFKEAFTYLYPKEFNLPPYLFESGLTVTALYIALPVIFLVSMIYARFIPDRIKRALPSAAFFKFHLFQCVLILLVSGCILLLSLDNELKTQIAIDRFAEQGEWEQVLNQSRQLKAYHIQVNVLVNRALYFQGQLLNELFSYPQVLGTDGLFIHRIIASQIAIPASDLLFDLAHISGAQTMAYEGQTKLQYNPRLLKRLTMTNLINHELVAAKKFADLLKQSFIHRKWAMEAEDLILHPSRAESNPEIKAKRALKPTEDFFLNKQYPTMDLSKLLEQHPENRMAFEYLIAFYLLDTRLMNVFTFIDQFPRYGYPALPRHVEEAILLLKTFSPESVDEDQIHFSPETLKRFRMFNMILSQTMRDPKKAEEALKEDFGDTYWFYVRYVNPRQTKLKLKARKIDEG
ncbi:hypothetical protein HQ585_18480 [candidate division KSB1 bacterium]|nr:hypothetical protein [candidate division KSB1 bacterium]